MGPFLSKNTGEALRAAGALSTVGLAFVLALVLGFWFGSLVDRWVGTKPVFTIVFFFFGLAAGILNVYRIVSQAYPVQAGRPAAGSPPVAAHDADAGPPPTPGADNGPDDHELGDDER